MRINFENVKLAIMSWFERGIHRKRDEEECLAYCEGLEDGIRIALEAFGHTSVAVYDANTIGSKADEHFYNVRNHD